MPRDCARAAHFTTYTHTAAGFGCESCISKRTPSRLFRRPQRVRPLPFSSYRADPFARAVDAGISPEIARFPERNTCVLCAD
jgi:hypothetical protein